jgi:hypothetical protein
MIATGLGRRACRRPSFSLRTLLVLVALFCGWLAWERHLVLQRRAARERFTRHEVTLLAAAEWSPLPGSAPLERATIPVVRRLLGDEAVQIIYVPRTFDQSESERAARLFPEARVSRMTDDVWGP